MSSHKLELIYSFAPPLQKSLTKEQMFVILFSLSACRKTRYSTAVIYPNVLILQKAGNQGRKNDDSSYRKTKETAKICTMPGMSSGKAHF